MRQIWFKKPQRGTSEQEAPMLGIFPRQMMWPDQAVAAQFSGEAAYLSGCTAGLLAVLYFGGRGFSGGATDWTVSHSRRRISWLLRGWSTSRRLSAADVWATWVRRRFGDIWCGCQTHIVRLTATTVTTISCIKQTQLYTAWFKKDENTFLIAKILTTPNQFSILQLTKSKQFVLTYLLTFWSMPKMMQMNRGFSKQEVKVIWQKAPHGGPIPRLGVTPGGRNLYHWIPGVGVPISVP